MSGQGERGETLVELLVAVVIMGIAVVAIVGGIGTSILMSDIHRKQATAGAAARDYAETIDNYIAGGHYAACSATSYTPTAVGFTPPAHYVAALPTVRYWDGSAWGATCSSDTGLQQLTVQVHSDEGADCSHARACEQVVVTVRKPCRQSDSAC